MEIFKRLSLDMKAFVYNNKSFFIFISKSNDKILIITLYI